MKRASSRSRWVGPPTDLTPLFSDLAHPESNALAYCDSPSDMGATGHVEAIYIPFPTFTEKKFFVGPALSTPSSVHVSSTAVLTNLLSG